MVVGTVPLDYAEKFGNALREFVPGSQVKMRINMEMGAAELWVAPGLTVEQFKEWNVIWWKLRRECQ